MDASLIDVRLYPPGITARCLPKRVCGSRGLKVRACRLLVILIFPISFFPPGIVCYLPHCLPIQSISTDHHLDAIKGLLSESFSDIFFFILRYSWILIHSFESFALLLFLSYFVSNLYYRKHK